MNAILAGAYMTISIITGNGTSGVVVPFASMDACLSAMAAMANLDAPGLDPVPTYCFDATTGRVFTR